MNRIATVEKVVVNSVMAGCLPEYIPVVIASIEAMLHNEFNLNGIQATTNCISPLAIVSGPVVEQLGFNAGDNVFGGGSRANAAVGIAIRLVLWNIGGGSAGEIDRATFGHPGKYTFCIAENSQDSPWGRPLHEDMACLPIHPEQRSSPANHRIISLPAPATSSAPPIFCR